jgi:hypothetical protein
MQLFPAGRKPQEPRAAVVAVYAALDDALRFETLHQQARIISVDAKPFRKAALIKARFFLEVAKHAEFEWSEILARKRFG